MLNPFRCRARIAGCDVESNRQFVETSGRASAEVATEIEVAPAGDGPWRVLVVEDVPSQQKLLVTVLRKAGHLAATAESGSEAVDLFRRQPFDVILMDVQMPGMNGLDAMRAIRESETGTGKRVAMVAVTAHALPGDAEQCLACGADAYLRKPIRLVEMMGLLKQLLERR
jgi:CheY-like chemotaxis protein